MSSQRGEQPRFDRIEDHHFSAFESGNQRRAIGTKGQNVRSWFKATIPFFF